MKTLPASEFRHGISMKCGCTASGTLQTRGQPALVACGRHSCVEVAETAPDLTGRTATCVYGGNATKSAITLPFFSHRPDRAHDEYYCGCRGFE